MEEKSGMYLVFAFWEIEPPALRVVLLFQPGEEGAHGARDMVKGLRVFPAGNLHDRQRKDQRRKAAEHGQKAKVPATAAFVEVMFLAQRHVLPASETKAFERGL